MYFVEILGKAEYSKSAMLSNSVKKFDSPWDLVDVNLFKKIARIHLSEGINRYIQLPFRHVWNRYYKKATFGIEDEVCFIFNAHYYWIHESKTLDYIKKNVNKSYSAIFLSDKYSMFSKRYKNFPKPNELLKMFDIVYTYNCIDANKHGFELCPPYFIERIRDNEETLQSNSDVFFVGMNKGRIEQVHRIYEECSQRGLKCDFYVSDVPKDQQLYPNDIKYNTLISYSEVLNRVRKTKCVLNIMQDGAQGVTLRDYEAFEYDKYLLTNNKYLEETYLYDEKQVIWLDENFADKLSKRISNPIEKRNLAYKYPEVIKYNWIKERLMEKK